MNNTLHILNGDGTRYDFEKAQIPGAIMVWHEMLVEGPATYAILKEEWFQLRQHYISEEYAYDLPFVKDRMAGAFGKLRDPQPYDQFVLWFEYDLFCQINMIGALSALKQKGVSANQISLVCPGEHPDIEDFRGLGQLQAEHFPPLFQERTHLSASDLSFTDEVYWAYCQEDPLSLLDLLERNFPPAFPFLRAAILAHLQRFPSTRDGLALEEREMLQLLAEGLPSRPKWVGQMLRQNAWRGYGDSQYFHRIERLKALFDETEESLTLNDLGQAVLAGERDFLQVNETPVWLGGARNTDWRWEEERQRLVPG